jgi:hypothetical protein
VTAHTVTCHTEGCGNADAAIELELGYTDPMSGDFYPVDSVVCGVCGEQITDVEPPLETVDPPDELDNTLPEPESPGGGEQR